MQEYIPQIQINANLIARMDCLLSFAKISDENRYVRPIVDDSEVLDIKQGRHPVIETQLPLGERYVPNDVLLDTEKQQIMMITGPNMAGKSALLRQTALIVLLAQVGCFVPAESARVGLVDKIFTCRCKRQYIARRIDLHGRDDRGSKHPEQRFSALAGAL